MATVNIGCEEDSKEMTKKTLEVLCENVLNKPSRWSKAFSLKMLMRKYSSFEDDNGDLTEIW